VQVKDFEKLTKKELRQRADDAFKKAEEKGPGYLAEAQFYMQELGRRHDSWISIRDLILEIVVIVLIGFEIGLAIIQGRDEDKLWDKQNAILNNLQTSTQSTAALLGQELDLEYALAINVEYNGFESVTVFNNSRSEAILGGIRVDGVARKIKDGRPFVIADHNSVTINLTEYNPKLREKATGQTKPFIFPVEIYISNKRGEEFVWNGRLNWGNSSGPLSGVPNGQLVIETWPSEIKPAVSQVPSATP